MKNETNKILNPQLHYFEIPYQVIIRSWELSLHEAAKISHYLVNYKHLFTQASRSKFTEYNEFKRSHPSYSFFRLNISRLNITLILSPKLFTSHYGAYSP